MEAIQHSRPRLTLLAPSRGGSLADGRWLRIRRPHAVRFAPLLAILVWLTATLMAPAARVAATATAATPAATTNTAFPDLPPGFAKVQLASGLHNPTTIAFAPNGDIYIGEQTGAIKIYRNGAILPTPVVTLSVDGTNELGLLGLALDPNYATNGYMYVSYTTVDDHAQLSRLTVVNGVASLSSEVVYARGNQVANPHHSANDVRVGPDGKLWWSVGDNVPAITNGRTLQNIYGKIHRFNLDGTIPGDNPFLNVPGTPGSIYAYGLRNPFRFTFLPDGRAMTEDTGSSYWEEMDTIQKGGNYGWDIFEGNCFTCGFINPAYAYGHLPTDGAASAMLAYSGSTFPQQYNHVVFVGDYVRQDIEAVAFDPTYTTETSQSVFDSSVGTIADLEEGPDGNLYYVGIFEGSFWKITAPGPFAPTAVASATPNAGLAPFTAQFSSAGSSDPFGLSLSYSWDFGDGSPVSVAPNPGHTYAANGTYTATLTVSDGAQNSTATTQVVVGNTPPTASITVNPTYNGGDTVSFSGTASDAVDGTLAPSAYSWKADFIANGVTQPFYVSEVPGPFYSTSGVTSGSFQIPRDYSNVPSSFYRITLTVTDSLGISTVVTRDIHPNTTTLAVSSNVAGTPFTIDGTWHTSAFSSQDTVGVQHVLSGQPLVTVGGTRYRFQGWADGSALAETIVNQPAGGTYTADYEPVVNSVPAPWQSVDIGAPITAGTADYSAGSGTFYVDGAGADAYSPNDQFHYVYQPLNGDGTIVARVRYQTNSSPWAKAGVMIKESATSGATFVDALTTPTTSPNSPDINGVGCNVDGCAAPLPPVVPAIGNGVRMQYSGPTSVAPAAPPTGAYASPNEWLKLQRHGSTFTSWYSMDGSTWTQIGSATLAMNSSATIGLFVTSHNIGQDSTAAFDNVQVTSSTAQPLPSPWTDQDIGAPAIAGSASYAGGVFTVDGAGADIFGSADQFNFASQGLTGNGTLTARITGQSNSSSSAKAGIMLRASSDPGSPYYAVLMTTTKGVATQWRTTLAGVTSQATKVAGVPPLYLRIVRSGNTFTAYTSPDGVTWTLIPGSSQTIALSTSVLAGMAVTSHNTAALGSATFDNVSLSPSTPPTNDFSISASPASRSVVQGASGQSTIATALITGTAETVGLSISGLPSGVTASFNPASVTAGGSSTLTLTVGAAVPTGTYSLTVTGTAASATHTTVLSLAVTAPPPGNDFSIAASPASVSIAQGASGGSTIGTSLVSGSAETIALSLSGAPAGVSASFSPASVATGSSSSLTLTVGATVATGTYALTVTGTAPSATHSTAVSLTVTGAAPPPNNFSIAASPASFTVSQGASGGSTIGTTLLSGVAESISLSLAGAPAGVSASFNPASVATGSSSSLTLTVGAAVPTGTYALTVTGTAPSATHSTAISLTVSAPSGGGLPSPWTDQDIGAPAIAGSASYAGGVFTVNGAGADIYNSADQFNFASQGLTGNGTLTVRITSQANTSVSAKAGIMLRASSDPGSPYYAVLMTTTKGVATQWRTTQGATTSQATKVAGVPPLYLRIVRSANTFTAYTSPDGVTWTLIAGSSQTIALPTSVLAGMAVTSHNAGVLGSATFDTVSLTSP